MARGNVSQAQAQNLSSPNERRLVFFSDLAIMNSDITFLKEKYRKGWRNPLKILFYTKLPKKVESNKRNLSFYSNKQVLDLDRWFVTAFSILFPLFLSRNVAETETNVEENLCKLHQPDNLRVIFFIGKIIISLPPSPIWPEFILWVIFDHNIVFTIIFSRVNFQFTSHATHAKIWTHCTKKPGKKQTNKQY